MTDPKFAPEQNCPAADQQPETPGPFTDAEGNTSYAQAYAPGLGGWIVGSHDPRADAEPEPGPEAGG